MRFIRYSLFVISLLLFLISVNPPFLYAAKKGPTCDLCGYCQGQEKPPDHKRCVSCLYDKNGSLKSNTYWTVAGCISTKPDQFVRSILNIVFAISGGLAFLAFIGGSAMILTSSGDPEKLNNGKSIVISSIFGLLLIIFSVFLLRFVGVDVLRVPGFG
ncbi:hypothetical protein HYW54_02670 [Candidatus Gottesmanbacteria bacterium]|nr:hypothetical protein [Candidatus Gottesmanbacteria bacterium]